MNEYIKIWHRDEKLERSEISRRASLIFQAGFDVDEAMEFLIGHDLVRLYHGGWGLTASGKLLRLKMERIDFGKFSETKVATVSANEAQPSSPWSGFRKLLSYYIDCVKFDERPNCRFNADNYNKKFIYPVLRYDWLPENAWRNDISYELKIANEAALFLRNAVGVNENQGLFLGYPVQLFRTQYGTLLVPVCVIPVEIKSPQRNAFKICPVFEQASFNHGWIEGLHPESRTAILAASGRIKNDVDEEILYFDVLRAVGAVSDMLADKLRSSNLNPERTDSFIDVNTSEPGLYNVSMLFIGERFKYSANLLRELKKIKSIPENELDKTSLAYVFRDPPISIKPDDKQQAAIPFLPLNQEQEIAVETALNTPASRITGPPGTGKSQAAANLIANLVVNGRSVLFSSKNHKAVEAVLPRCNNIVPGKPLLLHCNAKDGTSFSWQLAVKDIANIAAQSRPHQPVESLFKDLTQLQKTCLHLKKCATERSLLVCELGQLNTKWDNETEYLSKELLNASLAKNDYPSDSDIALLGKLLPSPDFFEQKSFIGKFRCWLWRLLRYKKIVQLQQRIIGSQEKILWQSMPNIFPDATWCRWHQELLQKIIEYKQIFSLNEVIHQLEIKCQTLLSPQKITDDFCKNQNKLSIIGKSYLAAKVDDKFSHISDELKQELATLLPLLNNINNPYLDDVNQLNMERFHDKTIKKLINYYPAWTSTLLSLKKALPLAPAIVDYAVIDEASQCEIPPVIPAMFRAKRIVVVGDPNQFRPVITMSRSMHQSLKFGVHKITEINLQRFDYLDINAFDLGATFPSIFLCDHFRGHDVIADYFNRTFYGGKLNILTNSGKLIIPNSFKPGITWYSVSGTVELSSIGPVAKIEIDAIAKIIYDLIEQKYQGTVGVVSPFRAHANALDEYLRQKIPVDIAQKWNFIASTAHSFQGDERDIIILSLAFQEGLPEKYKWLLCNHENRNLANVAVSRARALLIIVGDRERCKTSGVSFLEKLAAYPEEYNSNNEPGDFESPWEKCFHDALDNAGIKSVPQYPLAGRRLDLALPEYKIDIEIDGEKWHRDSEGHRKADDLWRDYTISLLGWQTIRFWVYELKYRLDECVQQVKKEIENRQVDK